MINLNEIRQLANELEMEYGGDLCELYAHVSNRIAGRSEPSETMLALKRELEHRIALEVMEEYSWERDDMGLWRKLSNDEFLKRFRTCIPDSEAVWTVERDPGTGQLIAPGQKRICLSSGDFAQMFECCCDECDYYLACYPEYQKEVDEALEDLRDLKAAELVMEEHRKNPTTYTFDEVLEEIGITREELDTMPDVELEQDGE